MFTRFRTITCNSPAVVPEVPPILITSYGDPYWSSVVALLHMDGELGSQTFIEEKGQLVTPAYVSYDSNKKFGLTSVKTTPGASLLVSLNKTQIFNGDFTIEGYSYVNGGWSDGLYFFDLGSNAFALSYYTGKWRLVYNSGNIWTTNTSTFPSTWFHWAVQMRGGKLEVYLDGQQIYSNPHGISVSSSKIRVHNYGGGGPYTPDGFIDEFRVTNGVARYNGNFTVSTDPFPHGFETSYDPFWDKTVCNLSVREDLTFKESVSNTAITKYGDVKQGLVSPFSNSHSGSLYFDGNGDYLSVPGSTTLSFGTSDLTVECWYRQEGLTTPYPQIFNFDNDIGYKPNVWSLGAGHGFWPTKFAVCAYNFSSNNAAPLLLSTTNIVNGTWYHVAITRSGNAWRMFVNGVLESTQTWAGSIDAGAGNPSYPLNIGGYSSSYIQGYVSNFRLTKSALYTENFTPSQSPLTNVPNTLLLFNTTAPFWDAAAKTYLSPYTAIPSTTAKFKNELSVDTTTSGYLTVGNSNYVLGTSDFTVEFWANARSYTHNAVFQLSNAPGGLSANNTTTLALSFNGQIRVFGCNADTTGTTQLPPVGTWIHIALVRYNQVTKLYVNGKLDTGWGNSGQKPDTVNYSSMYLIIGGYYGPGYWLNGRVQGFRITKAARYLSDFNPRITTTYPVSGLSGVTVEQLNQQDYDPYWYSSTTLAMPLQTNYLDAKGALVNTRQTELFSAERVKFGASSFKIAGMTNYGLIIDYNATKFDWWTSDYTLECWLNLNSFTGISQGGYSKLIGNSSNATTLWSFGPIQTGKIVFYYKNSSNSDIFVQSNQALTLNTWYHLAMTKMGTTITLFIDGIGDVSTAVQGTGTSQPLYPLCLGLGYNNDLTINGHIQDLRITKGVTRYTQNFAVPSKPYSTNGASF